MSVSTPLQPVTLSQVLARQQGQTVEARVLAPPQQDGSTQVQIGRQTVSLQLPSQLPVGSTITLSVQQVEGQLRVSLVNSVPPLPNARPEPVAPPLSVPTIAESPATRVQLSPLAQNVTLPPAGPASGGAPVSPVNTQATSVNPPPPTYSPPHTQYSNPQAGGRPDAPPVAQPVAAAVPTNVRPNVPYQQTPPPFVAAINSGGAAQLGERPPQGMGLTGQQLPQPGTAAPARAEGLAPAAQTAAPAVQTAPNQSPAAQAALAQMVAQAAPRQDSIAALTSVLASVVGHVPLPRDVLRAAQGVLGQQLSLDGEMLDPNTLKQAIRQSGVMHETMLSQGNVQGAGGDLKSSLMGLQRQLGAWLGANGEAVDKVSQLPPPLKGLHPRVRPSRNGAEKLPRDPVELGKVLLEKTEASLARVRLHQTASLPEPHTVRQEQSWSLDIPVQYAGQQTVLAMQIQGEPESADQKPEERGWQVRFAIHLADRGEVGAQLSLRGQRTSVLLWAEREDTGKALKDNIDLLQAGLSQVGLTPGALIVRIGAPETPARASQTHYVDATR